MAVCLSFRTGEQGSGEGVHRCNSADSSPQQGIATVGADRLYTAFHAQEITVLPSLTFRPTVAMRNLDDFVLSVDSMNDNILEAVDIVGVATVSHAWQVKADQTITFQS